MTSSYSGDPTDSDLDFVRDKIGDVDEDAWILTDEEIEAEITAVSVPLLAASNCARKIGSRYSRRVTKKIGELTINYSDLAKQYLALAEELKAEYQATLDLAALTIIMPSVGKVRDSIAANYPSYQKSTDLERQDWGDETE
jgi:hypothetical protein